MLHARDDYNEMGAAGIDAKIPDDEPVFLIRAQDENFSEVVRYWCTLSLKSGVDPDMVSVANIHANAGDQWQEDNPDRVKVPDMP